MRTRNIMLMLLVVPALALAATLASAADFDWTKDLSIRAEANPDGFRAQLATRFKIGDAQVRLVLGSVDRPADAYMIFRLGEMSSRSVDHVLERYRVDKGKGWGVLAKSLGIKPGSAEFHELKRGSDIDHFGHHGETQAQPDKGKGNGKGKDKGK